MLKYDRSRYLVSSDAQKQLQESITYFKRQRRRARLFFGLLIPLLPCIFFSEGYEETTYAVAKIVLMSFMCLLMARSIDRIFTAQDELKCIEANPAAYAAAQGWQGARLIADVAPGKPAALLTHMKADAPVRVVVEACSQALRRLLDLHVHCATPLPDLADAYLKAFYESQDVLHRIHKLLHYLHCIDCSEHEEKIVFSKDQLAEKIDRARVCLEGVIKATEQMADKFEGIIGTAK